MIGLMGMLVSCVILSFQLKFPLDLPIVLFSRASGRDDRRSVAFRMHPA